VNSQPGWLYEGNAVLHPRGSEYQRVSESASQRVSESAKRPQAWVRNEKHWMGRLNRDEMNRFR
jgi:hypothetical protein